MDRLNMSPSAFKRKFRETFGISAPPRLNSKKKKNDKMLIRKKEQKLIRDILMTNISIAELAEKYKFTANYMTTFCRKHFGKSPTELRLEHKK